MGSFVRLTAVYSDMPCESDQLASGESRETLRWTVTCARSACPTGAIASDRFPAPRRKMPNVPQRERRKNPFPKRGLSLNGTTAS